METTYAVSHDYPDADDFRKELATWTTEKILDSKNHAEQISEPDGTDLSEAKFKAIRFLDEELQRRISNQIMPSAF